MTVFNAALGRLFDWLLWPIAGLPPVASLAILSLATAVVMLLVVRRTSDQRALGDVKRQIHASLFEMRLFNDNLRAILRAQGELLRRQVTYLRLWLVPALWLLLPMVLAIVQLQSYYGYDGIDPGKPALVTMHVNSTSAPEARLESTIGVRAESEAIWFPAIREIVWRVRPEAPGEYALRFNVGGQVLTKTMHVSTGVARRSPSRREGGLINRVLNPVEPSLPSGAPITAITVGYPERGIRVFGWRLHWTLVFLVLSLLFAFALRKPLGVTI
jgi:hypothetical protein